MYSKKLNTVMAFHGCDNSVLFDVINGKTHLKESENDYDWLGPGIYFWESNLERAWEWARNNINYSEPAVIGAIIDLGNCLDFMDTKFLSLLRPAYDRLIGASEAAGYPIPKNIEVDNSGDRLLRKLDCAVIQVIHEDRRENNEPGFDTVRGVFWEGEKPYPGAGFKERNHIQISVRNPNCIKGYFLPRDFDIKGVNP